MNEGVTEATGASLSAELIHSDSAPPSGGHLQVLLEFPERRIPDSADGS